MKNNRSKNTMCFLLISIVLMSLLSINVFAKKNDSNYIEIDKVSTSIDYNLEDVIIERKNISNGKLVEIYDKNYKLLESIEEIDLNNGISLYGCGEQYYRLVTRSFYVGPIKLNISAKCVIYDECLSTGLESHVIRVEDPEIYISNSNFSSLEYSRAIIINNTSVQGIGVITSTFDSSLQAGLTLNDFKGAGFSVTGQVGTEYHLRKEFNKIVDFKWLKKTK